MELEYVIIQMDMYIMENGKMIKNMEKVFYIILMVKSMLEILKMEIVKDQGFIIIIIKRYLLVVLRIIKGRDMESILLKIILLFLENIQKIKLKNLYMQTFGNNNKIILLLFIWLIYFNQQNYKIKK